MIVTLTGDNDFLVRSEIESFKRQLGFDKASLAVTNIYGPETTLEDIQLALSSYSLFDDKRLVILNQPSKVKGFDELLEKLLGELSDSTHLMIIEPQLDKRRSYFKLLSAQTDFRRLDKLNEALLSKWLVDYAKSQAGVLDAGTAKYLVERVGDNQSLLTHELDKLVVYNPTITKESVDLLTEQSPSSTIFELLDAAFSLNVGKALSLYNEQRLQKVEPEQILAMLSWQLQMIAIYMTSRNLAPRDVQSASGLSPFTLNKARVVAAKLSYSNLRSLVKELSQIDIASKTVNFDLDEGLKNYIIGLTFSSGLAS